MHSCVQIQINNNFKSLMDPIEYQLNIKIRTLLNEVAYFCTFHLTVLSNHLPGDRVFRCKEMYLVIKYTDESSC